MWPHLAGARPKPVRPVHREEKCRRARPRRETQGGGQAAEGSSKGACLQAPVLSETDRRALGPGGLHHMRQTPGGGGTQDVRAVHRQAPQGRARPLREGQSGRKEVRRPRSKRQAAQRPRRQHEAPSSPPRGGTVRPLRRPPFRRGQCGLPTMLAGAPGGRARTLCRAPRRGALRQMRGADDGTQFPLRPLRRARSRARFARTQELSSILRLIILSDGKPGHRMSF